MISPRDLFQKTHQEDMKKLALVVNEGWFQRGVVFARAQMAADSTAQEKLQGVDLFLTALTNLTEETPPSSGLPDKSELKSYQ